ncbi:inner centromere protein A-like isoform X2 [Macrobrachium rosenbergii]
MKDNDHFYELFLQCKEKYEAASEQFEEHFVWLGEALAAAKLSFAHSHQVLLPKTPAAKKRGRPKRVEEFADSDDEASSSKRSQTGSICQSEGPSPECPPPRQGRMASRIAQERVTKSFKESTKRKLRRPSTPEEIQTVKKTRPTRQIGKSKNFGEDEKCTVAAKVDETIGKQDPDVLLNSGAYTEDLKKESLLNSKSSGNEETPKKLSTCNRRSSGIGKKLMYTSSDENDKADIVSLKVEKNEITELDKDEKFRSSEDNQSSPKKNSVSLTSTQTRDSGIEECHEEPILKRKSVIEARNTSQSRNDNIILSKTVNDLEIFEVSSEKDDLGSQSEPVPKSHPAHTKQKTEVSSQSLPVPKPRTTRTKQRIESKTDTDESDSGVNIVTCLNPQNQNSEKVNKQYIEDMLPPPEIPKVRSTRTKRNQDESSDTEFTEENTSAKCNADILPSPEIPKARSTRTKRNQDDSSTTTCFEPPNTSLKATSEHSSSDTEFIEGNTASQPTDSFIPPEAPKMRSTRTKKKQMAEYNSEGVEIEESKPRSTRTKKKMEELSKTESAGDTLIQSENEMSDSSSRSTRTKKRQAEQEINQPSRSTRTKRKKFEEEKGSESDKENSACLSDSVQANNYPCSPGSKAVRLIQKYQATTRILTSSDDEKSLLKPIEAKSTTNQRLTRSKIRQVPVSKETPKKDSAFNFKNCRSPASKLDFQRECCSPKSESGTPKSKQIVSRVASPLRFSPRPNNSDKDGRPGFINRAPFHKDILKEVEEIPSDQIEVIRSPVRVTRHSGGKAVKRESSTRRSARQSLNRAKKIALQLSKEKLETPDSRRARINPQPKTPSPQCPPDKIVRPKMGQVMSGSSTFGSSGRITPKTYSRIRLGLVNSASSSSTEYRKTEKKMNTPIEANRTKNIGNIVSGVTSFIKIQAPKPTQEDLEAKKLLEMQKKREREEEIRKKKEELMKSRAEIQKRRNEERMKRAREAREENERKAGQAKELQKAERKQREERLKEEQQKKKQLMLAKKQAEEESKARKIKEQMEEKRKIEEKRLAEEVRKAEEARRIEEERIVEEQRLQEEEKRKKKVAEVERITRERKELEQLKLREAERLAAAKKAAAVQMANAKHNATFNVDSPENKENQGNCNSTFILASGSSNSDSCERNKKVYNQNNYDIHDIRSDDSTDDESAPKKIIPTWAQGKQLKASLINQEYYPPDVNSIFPPEDLLIMPNLVEIFPIARRRFFKRTSSAMWTTPPHKLVDH